MNIGKTSASGATDEQMETMIKQACAKAGLDVGTAIDQYKALREKGMTPQVAMSVWHGENRYNLSLVTGDYTGILLSIHRGGRKKWPQGYKMTESDRSLTKADDRAKDPKSVWIHETIVAIETEQGVQIAETSIWDDPNSDKEGHPLLDILDNVPDESVTVFEFKGFGFQPVDTGIPKLKPRKGCSVTFAKDEAKHVKLFTAIPSVDLSEREKYCNSTQIYDVLCSKANYVKSEDKAPVVFMEFATTRPIHGDISYEDYEDFQCVTELRYFPDASEKLSQETLDQAIVGKKLKVALTLWRKKDNGELTSIYDGRIHMLHPVE